ncbi:MAG: L-threonylcarbamoyladenylate synthase [Paracoccaceae bacterium]
MLTKYLKKSETVTAGNLLKDGKLVAFPTETVYGLGARADSNIAIKRIFDVKGRPAFNPLIVHVASIEMAKDIAIFDDQSNQLLKAFWPGPITFVLPLKSNSSISKLVTANLRTVAIRFPSSTIAQRILLTANTPIAAPSANLSGKISPTSANQVFDSLNGKIDAILDGGVSQVGLESTIISTNPIRILRPGSITREKLENIGDVTLLNKDEDSTITAPGQLKSHYAPISNVRLNVDYPSSHEILLGFGNIQNATLNLSPSANLSEAASNLFRMLSEIDRIAIKNGIQTIAISPIPQKGIGAAINDRIERAAADKA